jgi:hypothetical protein
VAILSPAEGSTEQPEATLDVRVSWAAAAPVTKVEVWRDDVRVADLDLKKAKPEGAESVLEGRATVPLRPGPNRLRVVADGKGGRVERAVVVNNTRPSVLVRLEAIDVLDGGVVKATIKPADVAATGLVRVRGEVTFADVKDKALDDPDLEAVLSVNSVRQVPVTLGPRGRDDRSAVRRFDALIGLNRADNAVAVELYDRTRRDLLKLQKAGDRTFALRCMQPLKELRLHVLVVGVGVRDAEALRKRVLESIGAKKGSLAGPHGEFKHPAFSKAVLYPSLIGRVSRGEFDLQLEEVKKQIATLRGQTGWVNDVVLVYYQGEDWVGPGGQRWLLTSRNLQLPDAPPEAFAIPLRQMPPTPGICLLMLNLRQRPGQPRWEGPDAGAALGVALLRFAWSNPALLGADPVLLRLVQEAPESQGSVGAVADVVKKRVSDNPDAAPPVVDLPPSVADVPLRGPGR